MGPTLGYIPIKIGPSWTSLVVQVPVLKKKTLFVIIGLLIEQNKLSNYLSMVAQPYIILRKWKRLCHVNKFCRGPLPNKTGLDVCLVGKKQNYFSLEMVQARNMVFCHVLQS